ncbi:MAG: type IV pilus assembly protein PilM [Magnetococcales bacterium]|nr:type IV pilus assembly protein PilM [Magnetococcales bacterium]
MFSLGAHHKTTVGLDIGTTSIKAVELRRSGSGWSLHRIGAKPLPPKAMAGGKIKDKATVTQAIRDLWSEARFSSKRAAISVGGSAVIIKKIQLPTMSELDLEDQISTEAEEHIPFDIEEVYLDFQILSHGAENMDVLLSACKKEVVDNRLEAPREAGLDPVLCDLDIFCMANAVETFCLAGKKTQPIKKPAKGEKPEPAPATMLVNVGHTHLNLAAVVNGWPDFTRDHTFGGDKMIQEIIQGHDVSPEEAEQMLIRGHDARDRPWPTASREVVVHAFLEQLGNLVRQSVDFFNAGHPAQKVGDLYLSGGCALLPEATAFLNRMLNLPVLTANPFSRMGGHAGLKALGPERAPEFLVAAGLALRGDAP